MRDLVLALFRKKVTYTLWFKCDFFVQQDSPVNIMVHLCEYTSICFCLVAAEF